MGPKSRGRGPWKRQALGGGNQSRSAPFAEYLLCARQAHSAPRERCALGGLTVPTGPMRKQALRGSVPRLGSRGLVRLALEVGLAATVPCPPPGTLSHQPRWPPVTPRPKGAQFLERDLKGHQTWARGATANAALTAGKARAQGQGPSHGDSDVRRRPRTELGGLTPVFLPSHCHVSPQGAEADI